MRCYVKLLPLKSSVKLLSLYFVQVKSPLSGIILDHAQHAQVQRIVLNAPHWSSLATFGDRICNNVTDFLQSTCLVKPFDSLVLLIIFL